MLYLLSLLLVTSAIVASGMAPESTYTYAVDATGAGTDLWPHYWEEAVGSGHATLTLRADWRAAMALGRSELGFRTVRFHAIFDDDMSTFSNSALPSFFNIDESYDWLQSIGVDPLVELSFMPERLASADTHVFHYNGNTSPPKNVTEWAGLITAFAEHLVARYGIDTVARWRFEVWNEPNIDFWSGTQEQYFDLYDATARALKAVSPRIQVGGPVSSNSSWLPAFVAHLHESGVPADFVSSHQYPTDREPLRVDILPRVIADDVAAVAPLPFFLTEYNDGLGIGQHDLPYAAAFVLRNVAAVQGMTDLFSFWCISDIFEEQGQDPRPFQDNFGLMTVNGVRKPSWHAFAMLHATGNKRYKVAGPGIDDATVGIVATSAASGANEVHVLMWNHAAIQDPCPPTNVSVKIALPAGATPRSATILRVDENHANPRAAWEAMGSPTYPTPAQLRQLHDAAELRAETVALVTATGSASFEVTMPSQAAAVVRVRF